ncbi:hypothetical protein [Pontibacter sp. G13]|uniref:DinB family protein n=1 Tax=Pontibacter sp. G13 TaxID=3074898 RepID=UPI00288ABEBC|nr:hypothetical protein [Pontibacter sp. G13]WNJ19084.1 hypothetical protein RJD25_01220 [Pontibacter sp. G13]
MMNNRPTQNHGSKTESIPYEQIGDFPSSITPSNLLKRFLDGLGYRYHWATKSLSETDLAFRICEGARSSFETIVHIYDISGFVLGVAQQAYNGPVAESGHLTFQELRTQTLDRLSAASELFGKMTEDEFLQLSIKVQQGEHQFQMPLWNLLNGPISDAIYHVGQVVAYRRASGNPIDPRVDIFTGQNQS